MLEGLLFIAIAVCFAVCLAFILQTSSASTRMWEEIDELERNIVRLEKQIERLEKELKDATAD